MKNSKRLLALALCLIGFSLSLWNCNVVETGGGYVLQLKLDDSLALDAGKYDLVVVDLCDTSRVKKLEKVFNKAYVKIDDSVKLANLPLPSKPPDPLVIQVTAYKNQKPMVMYEIMVKDSKPTRYPPVSLISQRNLTIDAPTSPYLYIGAELVALKASLLPKDSLATVLWTLGAGTGTAEIVDNRAIRGLTPGTITLVATASGTPLASANFPMTVRPAPSAKPASITLSRSSPLKLTVGEEMTISAVVHPDSADQSIIWSVLSPGIIGLTGNGKVKALAAGAARIKAASAIDSLVSTFLDVEVTAPVNPVDPKPAPKSIVLLMTNPLILAETDAPVPLLAAVLPVGSNDTLIWSSLDPGVAQVTPDNKVKPVKAGTTTLTATSKADPQVDTSFQVKVTATVNPVDPKPAPKSIVLLMTTPLILAETDAPVPLLAGVLPVGSNDTLIWSSLEPGVAQVTADNKVKPVKAGTTTLTVKSKADPQVDTTFQVKVIVPVKVDAINILPKTLTLYTGGPQGTLAVTLTGNDTGAQFTLSSSDAIIATVSAAGAVKGLAAGSAVITAAVVGYPAVTSVCSVKVVKDPPVVTVTPNQNVAFNGEAVFTVSVAPQAYGTTVEIKADMDGDGVFEQTVLNKETADFKQKYTEVKSTTVSFKVKDTEGNEETVTRKVTVGAPGAPIVSIVNPSKDTTINVLSLKIRFTVKDTALKIDTFVDSTVTLIAGSNKVRAARTNAGGEGSDEVTVLVDNTAPTVAITGAATQTTGVAAFTLAGTASDLGSGLQSVNITGALTGNGLATLTVGDWSKGSLTLAEGANTLVATALDKAGNTKTASITVTLDSKKPGVPVVTAPAAMRAGPIKWTWTTAVPSNGSGKFKVKINTNPEVDASLAEYSYATPLVDGTTYGLSVKETDPIAGDGLWSAVKNVFYDTKAPDPVISRNAASTNLPKWSWTSNGGGATFRWHYKGAAAGSAGTGVGLSFAPTNLKTGTHNLCVQEKETAEWGETWGVDKCLEIEVDTDGPTITKVSVKGGALNSGNSVTINYTADAVSKSFECDLTTGGNTDGNKTCSFVEKDVFGNPSTVSATVTRNRNIIFVNSAASGGKKNGTNWDDAFTDLFVEFNSSANSGKSIWVASSNTAYSAAGGQWSIEPRINAYGGFKASDYPSNLSQMNPTSNKTTIQGGLFQFPFDGEGNRLDGFYLSGMQLTLGDNVTLANSNISGQTLSSGYGVVMIPGNNVLLDNVVITGNTVSESVVYIQGWERTVTIKGGEITNNKFGASGFGGYPVYMLHGIVTFDGALKIVGNTLNGADVGQVYIGGDASPTKLTVKSTVSIQGNQFSILMNFNSESGQYYGCLDYKGTISGTCN